MKTALDAFYASIVRTAVPVVVGAVLGWFTTANITLDAEFEATLTVLITSAFTLAYYVVVRLFERFVSPKLGWLLGLAQQPTSYKPDPPAGQ